LLKNYKEKTKDDDDALPIKLKNWYYGRQGISKTS
jgi:hypothetical protein